MGRTKCVMVSSSNHGTRMSPFDGLRVTRYAGHMKYLALDIGKKHTGAAYADSEVNIALPLDTIHHESDEELVEVVGQIVSARQVGTLVIGLPVLLSGKETAQTAYVRGVAERLQQACPSCTIEFLDERETSKVDLQTKSQDTHAQAAVTLLSVFLERA